MEELHSYKEVKKNVCNNILKIQTDLKKAFESIINVNVFWKIINCVW